MEDKDPTANNIDDQEEPSDLEDLGEEEVAQAVEGLKIGFGERGAGISIVNDPKMEAELKEMFRDIVLQYITPVGKSIRALIDGDLSDRNIEICIGALKPLIMAAEEIQYNDIYDVLKSIEQPLSAFRNGKKRLLSKKDIRNIANDYRELVRLISRSVGSDAVGSNDPMRNTAAGMSNYPSEAIADIQLSDKVEFFKDADPRDIQRLYAAGLIKLDTISRATAQEISESTGIALTEAGKLRQYAVNAISSIVSERIAQKSSPNASSNASPNAAANVKQNSPRIEQEEEEVSGVFANSKQRWITALDTLMSETEHYFQVLTALGGELERTHRALLRMRVARERLKGEIEFYHDDLVDMFETTERLNEELGTPTNAHRQLLKNLRRSIDVVGSALKKTEVIYGQLDDTLEEIQDVEAQLIALRRRKGGGSKAGNLRRRTPGESIEDAEPTDDDPLPRRLN